MPRNYAIALSLAVPSLLAVNCMIGPGIEPPGPEILPPEATMPMLSIAPIKRFDFSWAPAPGASFYQLLVSPTVDDPFVSIGVVLGEELSLSVPLHLRHQARYMLRACNLGGCTDSDPLLVTGSLAQAVGYFKASSVGIQDYFGTGVAVSGDGNTLAVGAYAEDSNASGIDGDPTNDLLFASGAVYVFTRDTLGQWSQQAYIKAGNPDPLDYFGFRLALSDDGDTLAVSAHDEDGSASGVGGRPDDALANAGAVYVFTRSATDQWSQQAYVKASNPDAGDGFGRGLALSGDGNTLAVGSAEDSSATGIDGDQADDSAPGAGAVYVFRRSASGPWSQQAYVKASNSDAGDGFGGSVSLSRNGRVLAVGASGEASGASGIGGNQADDSMLAAGAAYVFARDSSGQWSQRAYVKAESPDAADYFGGAVALSGDGNTLAVGARGEDGSATGIDGDADDDSAIQAGAVYVYGRSAASQWYQQAYVKSSNAEAGDAFGTSVALTHGGRLLVVGAPGEDANAIGIGGNQESDALAQAGAAYVFARSETNQWSQRSYVKAPNPDAGDGFGLDVALSDQGHTLAVGAFGERSDATGIGGEQADDSVEGAGAVYLY